MKTLMLARVVVAVAEAVVAEFDKKRKQRQQTHNKKSETGGIPSIIYINTAADRDNANSTSKDKWLKNGFGQTVSGVSGKLSIEESEKLRRAVEEYCEKNNISVLGFYCDSDHKADLKEQGWVEIAKVLPEHSVQSLYLRGRRQRHPFKRGLWTDKECEMLETLVPRAAKQGWADIQERLHRSAESCREKYREIRDSYTRGRWTENETELLKQIIREHLNVDDPTTDIKELERMVQFKGIKIPWSVIHRKGIKRSRVSCFKKWQRMTRHRAAPL